MADLLTIENLDKDYSGVPVLEGVSLTLAPGTILGLIGENGAGKSTLIKCLNGLEHCCGGRILLDGHPVSFRNTAQAVAAGISTVPQEFNLIGELSVCENLFLGREPRTRFGLLDRSRMRAEARRLLAELRADLDPDRRVETLNVAEKQFVEIARALSQNCRLLIMDEPTTVLNNPETELLFDIMRKLRATGVSIIFVSHKLREVKSICDEVAVLRDGRIVGRDATAKLEPDAMARMMVGRELSRKFPPRKAPPENAPVLLALEHVSVAGVLEDISFELHRGEILGVAGLGGSGRSEMAETIYGLRRMTGGRMILDGREVRFRSAPQAVAAGVALLAEDRQGAGVLLDFPLEENITLTSLPRYGRWFIDRKAERERAEFYRERFSIRAADTRTPVRSLSGGNQQKVAIAKGLDPSPKLFIFDEPTRGVDVGARSEVYHFIRHLADEGVSCLLISSDLEEIIGMCRRALVMRGGRLAGIVEEDAVNEEEIMYLATGVK